MRKTVISHNLRVCDYHFENTWTLSYKAKARHTSQYSSPLPDMPCRNTCAHVWSDTYKPFWSFLFTLAKNWRQLPCLSEMEWTHFDLFIQFLPPYSGTNKRITAMQKHTIKSYRHNIEWKKPNTNDHILYTVIYMKFKNRQNQSDNRRLRLRLAGAAHRKGAQGSLVAHEQGYLDLAGGNMGRCTWKR